MAVMYLNTRDFYLKSGWTGRADGTYTTPSLAEARPAFPLSQLPRGAAVSQAVLRVRASIGYTGGVLTVNGETALEREVTALIRPDSGGAYPDLTLAFAYRAYGGQGGPGAHLSTTHVTSAVIEVTYTADDGAAADTRAAVWRACCRPDRQLRPFAALRFPDGTEQAVGPEEIVSFRLDEGVGDGPLLGQAPAAALAIRLANTAHEWYPGGSLRGRRELLGARISLRMQVQTDQGPVNVPLGAFDVDEMRGDEQDSWLELRGFDPMASALEAVWEDTTAYPALLGDILANIAAQAGLGLEGVLACNRDRVIRRQPAWAAGCTLRQALMQVCAAGGSFASVSRTGTLSVRPAAGDGTDPLILTPALYTRLAHDERAFAFNRVTAWPPGVTDPARAVTSAVEPSLPARAQNTLTIRNNALFTGDDEQTRGLLGGLTAALTGVGWQALRLSWRGDPQTVIGRRVELTDRDGRTVSSLICGASLVWASGFSMTAVCAVDYDV